MLKIENVEIHGWEPAIRGLRNPKNSWNRMDSRWSGDDVNGEFVKDHFVIGPNDHRLMTMLRDAGRDHRKYLRMITVYADVVAPLYWWKEYDTYKVGTVTNSCSTMHKIAAKEFELDDFSHDHIKSERGLDLLEDTLTVMNANRMVFNATGDKEAWYRMIQLLPSSYNQKRTVMLSYEVLANQYHSRKNHKLDEWHTYCDWIRELPYSELITGEDDETDEQRG